MANDKNNKSKKKLNDEQIKEIIKMYTVDELTSGKIGKYFNVSKSTILNILKINSVKIRGTSTGNGRRKYSLNEHYFDEIDTPIKAYILGFFYADGSNHIPKSTISMSLQEEDMDILERIRNEVGSGKPLEFLDYSNKHDFGYTYKNQYRLLLFSAYMCRVLEEKGVFPNKSLILEFPEWLDESLYSHFIRGYYDGDGSVHFSEKYKNSMVTITSTEKFCSKLKEYVEKTLPINTYIADASSHNGVTRVFGISGSNQIKIFLDWLYKDADIYLERKYQKYINKYYNSSQVA